MDLLLDRNTGERTRREYKVFGGNIQVVYWSSTASHYGASPMQSSFTFDL